MVAGLAFCVCQAGTADVFVIRLSKPDTTYATFLDDRASCINTTGHWRFVTLSNAATVGSMRIDQYRMLQCMAAKGYRGDPDGWRAVDFYYAGTPPHATAIAP